MIISNMSVVFNYPEGDHQHLECGLLITEISFISIMSVVVNYLYGDHQHYECSV